MENNIQSRIKQIPQLFNEPIGTFLQNINSARSIFLGKKGVFSDKIEKIIEKYPRVNLRWLLTGEGVPVTPTEQEAAKEIEKLKKKEKKLKEKYNACCSRVEILEEDRKLYLKSGLSE